MYNKVLPPYKSVVGGNMHQQNSSVLRVARQASGQTAAGLQLESELVTLTTPGQVFLFKLNLVIKLNKLFRLR